MEKSMDSKFDVSLMVKVAQMYHIDGMKQEEIAKELQISRSLISMILTEAKDVGIIEINIRDPLINNDELSREYEKTFGLRKCSIVPTAVQDPGNLRKLITQRAVDVFNQEVGNQFNVGVAWGRTCYEFIANYKTDNVLKDVNIIPLIGGSSQNAYYFQLNEMVRLFAEKINGEPNFIHAPAINSSLKEKEFFINSSSMQPILEKWVNMDIIISGIGTLPDFNNSDRETYMGEAEIYKQLDKSEAVGDICARYFNIKGEFIKDDSYNRILGIPIENLKNSKTIICVASGIEKVNSILGALRTNIVDIFITDEQTAKTVLKANNNVI
jgi:deoxyribonucleoside regulator